MIKLRDNLDRHAISWTDLYRDTRKLTRQLLDRCPFFGIVALTRGGLTPTVIIACELEIRSTETLCVGSYDEQARESIKTLKTPEQAIADNGKTIREASRLMPEAIFATIYIKMKPNGLIDHYISCFDPDTWLLFPWDMGAAYVRLLRLIHPSR